MNRFGMMNYPVQILPQVKFQKKINIDDLCAYADVDIVRRSDKAANFTFDDLGNLRNDAFEVREYFGMSMNLLGGPFEPNDSRFKIKNSGKDLWHGGEVKMQDHLEDFEEIEEYCLVFFKAGDLHGKSIPYEHAKESPAARRLAEMFKREPVGKVYNFYGKSEIDHTPTNLNYWHVEFNIYNENQEAMSRDSTGAHKSASKYSFQHYFSTAASNTLQGGSSIPESMYTV